MKMLNLIGIGERAGSGVPELFYAWSKVGWEDPSIDEHFNPDRTILTLTFKEKLRNKSAK